MESTRDSSVQRFKTLEGTVYEKANSRKESYSHTSVMKRDV